MKRENKTLPAAISNQLDKIHQKPTLILWLRHFGCRFFQEAKKLIPSMRDELKKIGVDLACVMQGDSEEMTFTVNSRQS